MTEIALLETTAADLDGDTLLFGDRHVVEYLFELPGVDRRTHRGLGVESVAGRDVAGRFDDALDELVVDVGMDHGATRSRATLAGVAEGSLGGSCDCGFQIGVVEDDLGVLAAHLALDFLVGFGPLRVQLQSDLRRTGERQRVDIGVLDDPRADRFTLAEDGVEDAARDAGFVEQFRDELRRRRRLFGRFQHHGVAGDHRRCGLPDGDGDRKIPGGHEACDADRVTAGEQERTAGLRRCRLAVQSASLPAEESQQVERFLNLAARFVECLPLLAGQRFGKLLGALAQQAARLEHVLAALRRRNVRPCGLGVEGRRDRPVDVLRVAPRECVNRLSRIRRVDVVAPLPGRRVAPLAVDVVLKSFRHRG